MLLTASKQNLHGTEDKNMPRWLSFKAIWLQLQTSICWCHKKQKEDLQCVQAFPK